MYVHKIFFNFSDEFRQRNTFCTAVRYSRIVHCAIFICNLNGGMRSLSFYIHLNNSLAQIYLIGRTKSVSVCIYELFTFV